MIGDVLVTATGHGVAVDRMREELIAWGKAHFRVFPWRTTDDPFLLLMAEVMLHRTQARQVVAVYERFVTVFPDVASVAAADPIDLRAVLAPLGLHWRIALVQQMAREIVERHGGKVPQSRESLLALSGVSDYIASAVRCFAWNLPDAIVDTNTVRVVGRLFGLEIRNSSRRNRQFKALLSALVDPQAPRGYSYALLDLAADVCTARKEPDCERCPVCRWCWYGKARCIP